MNKNSNEMMSTERMMTYSAPLPEASQFAGYNDVLPGAADRILTMAEKQAQHRQELERRAIKGEQIQSFLGLILGFIIAITGLIGSIYLIFKGQSVTGTILAGSVLVSLVYTFVYGSKQRQKELDREE